MVREESCQPSTAAGVSTDFQTAVAGCRGLSQAVGPVKAAEDRGPGANDEPGFLGQHLAVCIFR